MQKRTIIGTFVLLALLAWYFSSFGWVLFIPFLVLTLIVLSISWLISSSSAKRIRASAKSLGMDQTNEDEFEGTYRGYAITLSLIPDTKEGQGLPITRYADISACSRVIIQKKFPIQEPVRVNFKRKVISYSDAVPLKFEDNLLIRGNKSDVTRIINEKSYSYMQSFVKSYAPSKLYSQYPLFIITPTSITFHRLMLSKAINALPALVDDLIDLAELL